MKKLEISIKYIELFTWWSCLATLKLKQVPFDGSADAARRHAMGAEGDLCPSAHLREIYQQLHQVFSTKLGKSPFGQDKAFLPFPYINFADGNEIQMVAEARGDLSMDR